MVEDNEERIADREARAHKRDRSLDEKLSSENPDKAETFNRRADRRRENFSAANYYESVNEDETERRSREE